MDQQSGDGNMHFENAFNGATQNAVGKGARVNIGTSGTAESMHGVPGGAPPSSGSISIANAFNNASMNAVGSGAQVNIHPDSLGYDDVPGERDQPVIWSAGPTVQTVPVLTGTRKIIISYSHKDRQWLDLLKTHLAFLQHQYPVDFWDDSQIAAGAYWQQTITHALSTASFALLLVSANFLASDFIARYELPLIRQRHSQGQLTIWPLLLSPCLFKESLLGEYQAFNSAQPLLQLNPAEREDVLVRVAREIRNALQ